MWLLGLLSWPERLSLLLKDSLKLLLYPKAKEAFSGTPVIPVNQQETLDSILVYMMILKLSDFPPREIKNSRQ